MSQRLDEVLARNYDADTVRRISFLKVDTEGFDSAVVRRRGERKERRPFPVSRTTCALNRYRGVLLEYV